MQALMQTLRNPGSSPQPPLLTPNYPSGYFFVCFFMEWGWQPRPRGQRAAHGIPCRVLHRDGAAYGTSAGKAVQPGRDAPRAALIKVPQLFPLCKTSLFHLWATIKRLSRGESGFARHPLHPAASLMKTAPAGQAAKLPSLHTCYGSWKTSASGCYNHTLFPVAASSFNSTWKMSNVGVRQP